MTAAGANLFDLSGKVAIVTGGAQGLGEAIARALANHGVKTVIFDVNHAAAIATAERIAGENSGNDVRAIGCDVRDDAQVKECVQQVATEYGRIDILMNNAGVHRRNTPFDFTREEIDAVVGVNLIGSFQMARAVGKVMVEQRSGSIVNMSALGGGLIGLGRGGSIYGATKGAIVALTRDLAAEWSKDNVRVNALAPGWIRTPMTTALQNDARKSAKVLERVPMRRWGESEEVAGPALFLASDASSYITGHTMPVDGGAINVIAIPDD